MILVSILLGTLLGGCQGLQEDLVYQYEYTATTSTWIPNDPTQSSGAALRATVELQLSQNSGILVKTSNIQVGAHHGKEACHANQDQEFSYQLMDPEDAAHLEKIFLVYFNVSMGEEVSYIEVPQEPVWVTNIRRGIVNSIPLRVVTGHHPPTLTFSIKEDTMIGSCLNRYSFLKLTDHQAKVESGNLEEVIEVDVQREGVSRYTGPTGKGLKTKSKGGTKTGKTKTKTPGGERYTIAPISDSISVLTRTLDDQRCRYKHFAVKINWNEESVERTQRSSEGMFLLRGEGRDVRLERSVVKGDIVVYSGEADDEFMRTASKQVLQLRAVRQSQETFSITYVPERRTTSFSVADGPHSTLEEKLLGISPDSQLIDENMEKIMEDLLVLRTRKDLQGEETPDFLKVFQRLVQRMSIIRTWTQIEELVNQVADSERLQYIIFQAYLASGREDAVRQVLESMKDQSYRFSHHLLVFQVLKAPTTPVRSAALIPAMLEVVSNMGEEEEVDKALSLLNIAKLASRYCLNSHRGTNCQEGCDTDFILQTFLPMLSQGLQDEEKWKRLLRVQAICALRSPYSIPYLQRIIQGDNNEDIDVRISAIYCLTSDLPNTAKHMVFDSLMPLMENPSEFPEVRSIAFLVLSTWEPSLSWWEHVAVSTWREKSVQVVSFISSTLISLSQGSDPRSKNVKKVVHLAKHPKNSERSSPFTSTYLYLNEVVRNCQARGSVKLAWLSSTKSILPRAMYYQLQLITVMGMTQVEKGVFITSGLNAIYRNLYPNQPSSKYHEDWETFEEIFMELSEDLELTHTDTQDETPFLSLFVSEPLPFLFVFKDDTVQQSGSLFGSLLLGAEERIPFQFRMADSTLVLASDLGLPVVIKHEEDYVIMIGLNSESMRYIEVEKNVNHRNALKMNTLVAWSKGMVLGAGLDAYVDVNLALNVSVHNKEPSSKLVDIVVDLRAAHQVKLMSLSNVMYTSMSPLYQVIDSVLVPEGPEFLGRKVVWNPEAQVHEGGSVVLPQLGIHLESKWTGDFEQPKDLVSFFKSLGITQLKYRNYNYMLLLHPELSITFTFTFDSKERKRRLPDQQTDQFTEQTRDVDVDDYESFSQVSQSSGFEIIGQSPEFGLSPVEPIFEQEVQHSQTFYSHLSKMQALTMPTTGGTMYTVALIVEPQNSRQKYEVAVTQSFTNGNLNQKALTKVHIGLIRSPATGVIGDTHLTCLDIRLETPYVLPIVNKEVLLDMDLASNVFISLYNGGNCDGAPGLELQANFSVSSTAIEDIHSMEEADSCDREVLGQSNLFYDQAVIGAKWKQDYRILSTLMESGDATPEDMFVFQADWDEEKEEWKGTLSNQQGTSVYQLPGLLLSPLDYNDYGAVCHLSQHSVETYDGALHSFEPSPCWTTATIFSEESRHPAFKTTNDALRIAVQVRFNEQWEVRIIKPMSSVVIDMTRSEILVNEEPIGGPTDKFVTHRLLNSTIIEIGMIAVQIGDTVNIVVSDTYSGTLKGLCGNYDDEPINDMMGPTGCLYTDTTLHTLAWSTPGQDCRRLSLRRKKRPLEEYRETCDRVVFKPTGISQQNPMKNCTEWTYDEKRDPTGVYCKSKVPIPKCRQGCVPGHSPAPTQLVYSCQISPSEQVQYGENNQCFTIHSPMDYVSNCFHQ